VYVHQAMPVSWPLTSGVRLCWLQSCCAVAEGADVPLSQTVRDVGTSRSSPDVCVSAVLVHALCGASSSSSASRCPPDVCVSAVLGDALHRVAVLGGREGMPRSLGSVYGGSITRFLGGGLRGVVSRVLNTPCFISFNGMAVSVDGSTLLASACSFGGPHAIHEISIADGSCRRVVGGSGSGPLQFKQPRQVSMADDGFVFVADSGNHRVQVLTPSLDFHGFVGVDQLHWPGGVCANADVVVASEMGDAHRISVFNRRDGTLLRRFDVCGGDTLHWPWGLCFMPGDRHIAVAEGERGKRVSVFSVDGDFIRHVGAGVLPEALSVACSASGELVVAGVGGIPVAVFSASGELVMTMGDGGCSGVAVHGGTVFAQGVLTMRCVVFE
jgi:hypothetical protein